MHDLRLIGVHEDGLHLLLADAQGKRFTVPLDESLRSAARREAPRYGQLQMEMDEVRPKDVQTMIRAGMTAEEVAERAGWPVEKVHRYEVPILAEREHVAGLAQQVRLRARGGAPGGAPTLEARVTERLRSREIDTASARWDSRRADKGVWTVLLHFNAGGRRREAAWEFDLLARTVTAVDDEARWLSEDEDTQLPGPIPAPHLASATRPGSVYDVEAEGGIGAGSRRRDGDTVDLMAAMRERSSQRGRRRRPRAAEVPGIEHAPEEALPLEELAVDPRTIAPPPAAHPHPEDDPAARRQTKPARPARPASRGPQSRKPPAAPTSRAVDEDPPESDVAPGAGGADLEGTTDGVLEDELGTSADARAKASANVGAAELDDVIDDEDDEPEALAQSARPVPRPAAARRSGRTSVPSWDDVMFGRRTD